jgi:hypothetical protein
MEKRIKARNIPGYIRMNIWETTVREGGVILLRIAIRTEPMNNEMIVTV